jgi:O-antigen ligase
MIPDVFTEGSLRPPLPGGGEGPAPCTRHSRRGPRWLGALPAGVLAVLLLLGTVSNGAFDLSRWGPPTIFGLVALAATVLAGSPLPRPRAIHLAVLCLWGFVAWTLLSGLWAESAGQALEGGARTALYAAVVTLPLASLGRGRDTQVIAGFLVAGLAAIAVYTLARISAEGPDVFLAGRLDAPVGYRNGTATLFGLAFWPLACFAAARGGNALLRALASSTAVLSLALAFLTQSRGVLVGLVAGALVAVGVGPDRVRRAWAALLAVGGVALASRELLDPYDAFIAAPATGPPEVGGVAEALALLAIAAFVGGLGLAIFDNGLRTQSRPVARLRALARVGLGVVVAGAAAAGLVAMGDPVTFAREKVDEFKTLEQPAPPGTRLGTTGGQRYDLWRVAWREFQSAPLVGVGEGSYDIEYYRERRTDRNVSDPHSLAMRLLAETGVVGVGLFVGFLAALGVALASAWSRAPGPYRRLGGALLAGGMVVLAQSLVDWTWLLPGVTGLGFFALGLGAALVVSPGRGVRPPMKRSWTRAGAAAALSGLAAVAPLLFVSDFYLRKARAQADRSPEAQLSAARAASRLNPFSVTALYLEASALESLGRRQDAREVLDDALALEPRNFATLALLGDLSVRAGDRQGAFRFYRRALALNPRDEGLRQLARGRFRF